MSPKLNHKVKQLISKLNSPSRIKNDKILNSQVLEVKKYR